MPGRGREEWNFPTPNRPPNPPKINSGQNPMSRPRKDDFCNVQGQLAPPPLEPGLLRLWHREFDRFPAGYFTACDVSGMVLYLHTLAEFDAALLRAKRARSVATQREERKELRAISRPLVALMRALRMFPSTRAHPTTMGRLANDPAKQVAPENDEPGWRTMLREAGASKPN